jgi:hypothetical protein
MLKQGGTILCINHELALACSGISKILPEGRFEESHVILPLLTYGGKCEGKMCTSFYSPSHLLKIYVDVATETMWTENCPRIVHYYLTHRIEFVS